MTSAHILALSENPSTQDSLRELLATKPCHSELFGRAEDALRRLSRAPVPDLVLFELNGDDSDMVSLQHVFQLQPDAKVVVVSIPDNTRKIVEAIRLGARDYLTTPIGSAELERVIRRHMNGAAVEEGPALFSESIEDIGDGRYFVAASPYMQKVRAQLAVLAAVDAPVLILGESGTGKEIAARLIRKLSSRANHRFIKINCAALPGELLESELFGYERGAFTGALKTKPGKFEICEKGTILLDEVAEMPAHLQAKLLHVLQDRQFFRLGGENTIDVDVRILAATNVNVVEAIAGRRFREDLYYRLSAFTVFLPPLRERREEIPTLLRHFMARMAAQYSRPPLAFSKSLLEVCRSYSWPGNLRELENFVKRYLVMGDEAIAMAELTRDSSTPLGFVVGLPTETTRIKLELPADRGDLHSRNLKSLVQNLKDEAEIQAITQALQETRWNRKRAARLLNISYRGLLYKIRRYDIRRPSRTEAAPLEQGHSSGNNGK